MDIFLCVDCHAEIDEQEAYDFNGHVYCSSCQANNARLEDEKMND